MQRYNRIACLGGLYSNYLALESALDTLAEMNIDAVFCLGDLGAFGPHPDKVFPLLYEHNVTCLQGNYDDSIGNQLDDCQCGYTDPRDNHFAQLSYDYTLANTSAENKAFLRTLPTELRIMLGNYRVLLCHGSPRRVNEFLWETTTATSFLEHLCDAYDTDVIVATHTGIKWYRELGNDKHFVNVGVLGRPENDGTTNVWCTILEASKEHEEDPTSTKFNIEFVPVHYDHERLAAEMQAEKLPEEFIATIKTGWWTTCLEVLPGKERLKGIY